MDFKIIFLLFIIYSFLGWIVEVLDIYFEQNKLLNRGFLIGPVCPIYGVGCLLLYFLLKKYMEEPIVVFVLAIVICALLEYFTSYVMEKIFKVRWWDYSNKKYNINGRICLETMLPFGIMGCLILYYVNPFCLKILGMLNSVFLNIIFYSILTIFVVDLAVSLKVITNIKFVTSNVVKDNTEEITKKVRQTIINKIKSFKSGKDNLNVKIKKILSEQSYFTKRFVNSFPKFKIIDKIKKK